MFRSLAQERKFRADPRLRKYISEFASATPPGIKLPERVSKARSSRRRLVETLARR